MKRLTILFALLFGVAAYTAAQEIVTLTTPRTQTDTTCTANYVGIDLAGNRVIVEATFVQSGAKVSKVYDASTSPTGATLIHSLNTANFTVNSFTKAVYNRLSTDGICVGTVSGTPQ